MPNKKSPHCKGTHLAALKAALIAEQQVLGLDTHTARERTDALLHATPQKTWPASVPSVLSVLSVPSIVIPTEKTLG